MKSRLPTIIFSTLLSIFLFSVAAFLQWDRWFKEPDTKTVKGQPDMIANAVEQWSFDENGIKKYQLFADTMQQFVTQNQNIMYKPSILFFDGLLPSWKTSANEALSDTTTETLHLAGNVTIEQKSVEEAATLKTNTLILHPKTSYATTDDQVIIRKPGIYIEAIGLDADLNSNKITLRTNVTSIYEPEKL